MQHLQSGPVPSAPVPIVACILVNWNNWQDTAGCLSSLAAQDYAALRVIVVDNGSSDDSVARLRAAHPWVSFVENGLNAGYPKACNLGARHPQAADAAFLWLLNNDTLLPSDTASKLVRQAVTEPHAGVIGSVLFYAHDPTRVQAWGGGRISRWTGYNSHFTSATDLRSDAYITFASALIRRETFDHLHGLFEGAFLYFEDSDFCLRAVDAGWQLAVAASTAILHKEGGSVERNVALDRIVTVSGLTFLQRHAPVPAIAQTMFAALRIVKRAFRLDWRSLRAVLDGIQDFRNHRQSPIPQR